MKQLMHRLSRCLGVLVFLMRVCNAQQQPRWSGPAGIILAQTTTDSRNHALFRNLPKPRLQLTTSILEQKSCSRDHFGLRLRLTVRNVGEEPVILHKQRAISRIMVSSNLAA